MLLEPIQASSVYMLKCLQARGSIQSTKRMRKCNKAIRCDPCVKMPNNGVNAKDAPHASISTNSKSPRPLLYTCSSTHKQGGSSKAISLMRKCNRTCFSSTCPAAVCKLEQMQWTSLIHTTNTAETNRDLFSVHAEVLKNKEEVLLFVKRCVRQVISSRG